MTEPQNPPPFIGPGSQWAEDTLARLVLDAGRVALWAIDVETRNVEWSEGAAAIMGVDRADLSAQFLPEPSWIHPDDRRRCAGALANAFSGLSDYNIDHRVIAADGSVRWVSARGALVLGPDGRQKLAGVCVDSTELNQMRQAFETVEMSRERMIAMVSHELRTPLSAIVGFGSELADHWDELPPGIAREYASMIVNQGNDLGALVDDLLLVERLGTENLRLAMKRVSLEAEFRSVLKTVPAEVSQAITPPAGDVVAWADPVRTRQIVRNLVVNAHRYGGDEVNVEIERADGKARFRVVDNGSGIPVADREDIFLPYTQAGGVAAGSTGLGLAVSRHLARLMGGDLTYSYSGSHSVFQLTLPAAV